MIAELLSEVLREQGLDVTTMTSGAAAIAALESGASFDLLVSDLSMPDVTGLDVTRAARARRPGLPTIILTGYAGDAGALRLEQIGVRRHLLRKPVTGDELLNAIRHLGRPDASCGFQTETASPPPTIAGNALVRQPQPLGRLPPLPEHVDGHAAARIPVAADAKPAGRERAHQILGDADGAILVEGAVVAIRGEVKL